jgi:hypothetical protein
MTNRVGLANESPEATAAARFVLVTAGRSRLPGFVVALSHAAVPQYS